MISIIVPVYNEAEENILRLAKEAEEKLPAPFKLYFVYDIDEDKTLPVIKKLAEEHDWIFPLKNNIRRGLAGAIHAGFAEVKDGAALVVMADLSDELLDVKQALNIYNEGASIVCFSRYMEGGKQLGGPRLKKFLSHMAGLSLKIFAGLPTSDVTNNFRMYNVARMLELNIESVYGPEIAFELLTKAHFAGDKIVEIPTTWKDREAGESNFKLGKILPHYLKWYFYALKMRLKKMIIKTENK